MKILHVTAQKPDSTGSGVYLAETVVAFARLGVDQAVIAGIAPTDEVHLPAGVLFRPVIFGSSEVPFPVVGMSDEMPYRATRYRDMTASMVAQFKTAFDRAFDDVLSQFKPDLVICHHLYLVCAVVAQHPWQAPITAISHSTDIRQMKQIPLERDFIRAGVQRLDVIFALHGAQADEIVSVYGVPRERIAVIGTGYNAAVFNRRAGKFLRETTRRTPSTNSVLASSEPISNASPRKALSINRELTSSEPSSGESTSSEPTNGELANSTPSNIIPFSRVTNRVSAINEAERGMTIAYAGKIWEKKGVRSLLRAVDLLPEMLSEDPAHIHLNLAGGYSDLTEYDSIVKQARDCAVDVHFEGRLSQQNVARLYRRAHVFVLPSFFEGLPLVIIEALACGCTVVATDLPGIREWIEGNLPDAPIIYVKPPRLTDTDSALPEDLPAFERRLAKALAEALKMPPTQIDTSALSWDGLVQRLLASVTR